MADVKNFGLEVEEKSHEVPVLVDFWAPWCGPCRFLGPVLDKLAGEAEGKWILAKVNVDENPEVSQKYGVSSIPDVKLFHRGEVVDGFVGSAPEGAIKKWLDYVLPSPEREKTKAAVELMNGGNQEEGREVLEEVVRESSKPGDAHLILAKLDLFEHPAKAVEWVSGVDASSLFAELAEDIRLLARLLTVSESEFPEASIRDKYLEGIRALRAQDLDTALDRFIYVIQVNKSYDDQGARKATIALFRTLGEQHPMTVKYRRAFSMALS